MAAFALEKARGYLALTKPGSIKLVNPFLKKIINGDDPRDALWDDV